MKHRRLPNLALALALALAGVATAQEPLLLTGARVLNAEGTGYREAGAEGTAVLVRDGRIAAVGSVGSISVPADVRRVDLSGKVLIPGLIDLHTHLLLHPYDETPWNDQVLKESLELRTIRGVVAARATLAAGFTTIRELGTEGAAFADVALRDAVAMGMIPGPRIFAATRALVAEASYGPSGFDPRWRVPKGAQEVNGADEVRRAVRQQIAAGADWIKVYADYRRKPGDASTPTFTVEELRAAVDEATSAGLPVAAHAATDEAIHRAVTAGVKTIEHGYGASAEVLARMRDQGVVLCPTVAAGWAISRQQGWDGSEPAPPRVLDARALMRRALASGVTVALGSDAGVFAHGDNALELELLVDYGMTPEAVLRAATTTAAAVLGRGGDLGRIEVGFVADLVALEGDPLADISNTRKVALVIQGGRTVP
jgi:imidazolonepropionase-like amidohydrolase